MNIGIETNILGIDKAGAAVYTSELIKHLKLADNGNSYHYLEYGSKNIRHNSLLSKIENLNRDILWMQFQLAGELKKSKLDLLHCPAFKAPLKCPIPLVVTFYDIHILKSPNDYNLWLREYCKFMLPKIAKSADKIITISEFSKKDIAKSLSISEEKIAVTYCGINDRFRVIADTRLKNDTWKKYSLKKRFILYVGALQPRKNIPALLKAYCELKKGPAFDYDLVFAGSTGWRNREIFTLIDKLGLKNDIKFLGHLP
ncbi:MAG: glycosyltransferase family 1 protein, partial [Candidatus Omnitrophica bacterium]|nr:glycosyltransferase family 1 protein [Candidatus Omnitrophota bacterium]